MMSATKNALAITDKSTTKLGILEVGISSKQWTMNY